jgi:hypothetical protein
MPTGQSSQETGVLAKSREKGRCCTIMETFTRADSQKASKKAKEFISIEIKVPSLKDNGKRMSKKEQLKSAMKTEKCKFFSLISRYIGNVQNGFREGKGAYHYRYFSSNQLKQRRFL